MKEQKEYPCQDHSTPGKGNISGFITIFPAFETPENFKLQRCAACPNNVANRYNMRNPRPQRMENWNEGDCMGMGEYYAEIKVKELSSE